MKALNLLLKLKVLNISQKYMKQVISYDLCFVFYSIVSPSLYVSYVLQPSLHVFSCVQLSV